MSQQTGLRTSATSALIAGHSIFNRNTNLRNSTLSRGDIRISAQVLSEDTPLITNWEFFYASLDFRYSGIVPLKNSFANLTTTSYVLLDTILTEWKSKKPQEATLPKLIEVLEGGDFNSAAELLKTEFSQSESYLIQTNPTRGLLGAGGVGSSESQNTNLWELVKYRKRVAMGIAILIGIGVLAFIGVCLSSTSGPDPPSYLNQSIPSNDTAGRSLDFSTPDADLSSTPLPTTTTAITTLSPRSKKTKKPPRNPQDSQFITSTITSRLHVAKSRSDSFKTLFHTPKMSNLFVDNLGTLANYKTAICRNSNSSNSSKHSSLQFNLSEPFAPSDLNLSCIPYGIKGLSINSYMSLDNLHQILQTFSNASILKLHLQPLCNYVNDNLDKLKEVESYEVVRMDNLRTLKIENITSECTEVLESITYVLEADLLKTLIFSETSVQIVNVDNFDDFATSYPSVKELSFNGLKLCPKCELFSDQAYMNWTAMTAVNFQVHEESLSPKTDFVTLQGDLRLSESAQNSLCNLLRFSPSLEYLKSNVAIPKAKGKGIWVMPKLRFLNATVQIPDDSNRFTARFFSLFPNLRESYIKVVFGNETGRVKEGQRITITNLKKYVGNRTEIDPFVLSADMGVDLGPYDNEWGLGCRDYGFQTYPGNGTKSHQWRFNKCQG